MQPYAIAFLADSSSSCVNTKSRSFSFSFNFANALVKPSLSKSLKRTVSPDRVLNFFLSSPKLVFVLFYSKYRFQKADFLT